MKIKVISIIMVLMLVFSALLCSCSTNKAGGNTGALSLDDADDDGSDNKFDQFENDDFTGSSDTSLGSDKTDVTTAPSSDTGSGNHSDSTANSNNTKPGPTPSNGQSQNTTPTPSNTPKVTGTPKVTNTPKPSSTPKVTSSLAPTQTPAPEKRATIVFEGKSGKISGSGAAMTGSTLNITKSGIYSLSGKLDGGQIVINVPKTERVYLNFNGVTILGDKNSAIWIQSADKTVITLADGTTNTLTDSARYTNMNASGEPNACLFSKDDLTIKGNGTLNVTGRYNNAITSKDDLKITGGTINITATKNGLRGNDSVAIAGATIKIKAKKDGIKVSNDIDSAKGYVLIESGNITIECDDDGIQCTRTVDITGGKVKIKSGGKEINCDGKVNVAAGCLVK